MERGLTIERAARSDAGFLSALFLEAGFEVDTLRELEHAFADVWVARVGDPGLVVGALLAWHVVDEVHIHQLVTLPDRRRQGIGRALLAHVIARARSDGRARILLEVKSDNQAALALYRAFGFEARRVRRAYYADGSDAFEMDLDLRAGGASDENLAAGLAETRQATRVPPALTDPLPAARARPAVERRRIATLPLTSRRALGAAYHVLSFEDPEAPVVLPGQFAMVRGAEWGDAPLLPRPMSYVSGGERPSILIKTVGEGTRRMARAEPGEPFVLLGPLGVPWREPDPKRTQVLVGGGVGIAPLLFLAHAIAQTGRRAVAIYGGRGEHDLPLADELAEVSTLRVTTEDGSRGARGRVTDVLEPLLAPGNEVYTCGPNAMMAAVAALCHAEGVPCEASLETPMGCGYGVCLGCPVPTTADRYAYACVEGPCFDADLVAWPALLRAKTLDPDKPSRGEGGGT